MHKYLYGDARWAGAVAVALLCATQWVDPAAGVDTFWDAGPGNWDDDASWNTGAEPTAADAAFIGSSFQSPAMVTITQAGEITQRLTLGNAAGEMGRLDITSGDLTVAQESWLGRFGHGEVNQSGGTATFQQQVRLARDPGASAVYNMTGGTLNTQREISVGFSDEATFNQSGGTVNALLNGPGGGDDWAYIGRNPNGTGTYNISGGTFDSSTGTLLALGFGGGEGVINQSTADGASLVRANEFWVGWQGGSQGTYNMTDGELEVRDRFGLGRDGGTGVFNQSGGTVNVGTKGPGVGADSWARVGGAGAGSVGIYNMTGGTLNAVGTLISIGQDGATGEFNQDGGAVNAIEAWLGWDGGATGTYNITGGSLNVTDRLGLGRNNGTGIINQSGGTVDVQNDTYIGGEGADGTGVYTLSGGTLTTNNNTGTWTFIGRNGATGTLNLDGGTLNARGTVTAFGQNAATGTINHNAGDATYTELWGGWDNGAQGTYNLTDGNVRVNDRLGLGRGGVGGTGVFNQDGGTVSVANALLLGEGTGTGIYNLNAGTYMQDGGDLGGRWNEIGISNGGTGEFNISGGLASFSSRVRVGSNAGATGTINQTGGRFEIRDNGPDAIDLPLGDAPATATYNISGGELFVNGGIGVAHWDSSVGELNISGTANVTLTEMLIVGNRGAPGVSANGTVNMSGGELHYGSNNGASHLILGNGGESGDGATGTFNMDGGLLRQGDIDGGNSANWNRIGQGNGATGTFNLSDGTASFSGRVIVGGSDGATGVVNQTGGRFEIRTNGSDGIDLALGDAAASATYNISGGELDVNGGIGVGHWVNSNAVMNVSGDARVTAADNIQLGSEATATGRLVVTGGDAAISAGGNYTQNNLSTLNSVLNNQGVANVQVAGSTTISDGVIDADLAGGVALLASDTHDLVGGGTGLTDNSVFNEVLWNKLNTANTVQIQLDAATQVGTIDFSLGDNGGVSGFAENAAFVEFANTYLGQPLPTWLEVEIDGPSLQDLADWITGGGNETVVLPPGDPMGDLFMNLTGHAGNSFFAWDLSDFDTAFNSNSPTLITGIFAGIPEPVSAVLLLGGAGAMLMRRRRT